jgi:hypothetical protein
MNFPFTIPPLLIRWLLQPVGREAAGRGRIGRVGAATSAFALLVAGCGTNSDDPQKAGEENLRARTNATAAAETQESDAMKRMRQIVDRYRQTPQYADQGQIVLQYRAKGQPVREQTQVHVEHGKPNRLMLTVQRDENRLTVWSDGTTLKAMVRDPATRDLDGQVVQRPQGDELLMNEIYATTEILDPAKPQQMISLLLALPLHLQATPLGLLLPDGTLDDLILSSQTVVERDPVALDGVPCQLLELTTNDGPMRLLIDTRTSLIRRIEYSTASIFQHLPESERPTDVLLFWQASDVSVEPIRSGHAIGAAADLPGSIVPVQYFVMPPLVLPTERMGRPVTGLSWVGLDGVTAQQVHASGEPQVLVWFDDQPASRQVLQQLTTLRQTAASSQLTLHFRAICVLDSQMLSDQQLDAILAQWSVDLPLARDPAASGRDELQVSQAPTTVVLDAHSQLQMFEVGANPQLAEQVRWLLGELASGTNVGTSVAEQQRADGERYQRQLAVARIPSASDSLVGRQELPKASTFRKLTARERWASKASVDPGNLLVPTDGDPPNDPPRILVLDQMREIVELDSSGQELNRHPLPIPEASLVARLHHQQDRAGGHYYVGFTQLGKFAYVFHHDFTLQLSYPGAEQTHQGITDARLDDLDEDGQLELYLAFAAPDGCQRVSLEGTSDWNSGEVAGITSLARHPRLSPPWLLAIGDRGLIQPIDAAGQLARPIQPGARTIHQLTASRAGQARPTDFLGLAYSVEGRLVAVGLDGNMQEVWSYGLPGGTYQRQIEIVQSVPTRDPNQVFWLLAGPDGSVHLVRDDGGLHDTFSTGSPIHGLTAHPTQGGLRIYVASPTQVTAYDVALAPR